MDAEGNQRIDHYNAAGELTRSEDVGFYQLDDGSFVVYRSATDADGNPMGHEESYFGEDGTMTEVRFDANGELEFERINHPDGSSTTIRTERDGTEVFETEDIYGIRTVDRYNPETGESTHEFEDEWGNRITESWDSENN